MRLGRRSQALDRRDGFAVGSGREIGAGADGGIVDQNRAGAADGESTCFTSPEELELLAQHLQKCPLALDGEALELAVDRDLDVVLHDRGTPSLGPTGRSLPGGETTRASIRFALVIGC